MAEHGPDEKHLIELLRLHSDEVRSQVALNWDRAKSSLTFHVALLALTATIGKQMPLWAMVALFVFGALSALTAAEILHFGHVYYRSARDRRAEVERMLGTRFGFVTTPGMRQEKRGWGLSVTRLLVALHLLLAALFVAAAFAYGSK